MRKLNKFMVPIRQTSALPERQAHELGVKPYPLQAPTAEQSYKRFLKPHKMSGGGEVTGDRDDKTPGSNNIDPDKANAFIRGFQTALGGSPQPAPAPVKHYANGGVAEYGVNDRGEMNHAGYASGGMVIEGKPDKKGATFHAREMTPKEEDQAKQATICALKHMLNSLEEDKEEDEE
jgi:hypothetical protein